MQRTRWLLIAVALIVGVVWIGQGMGVLQGSSFMIDDRRWAVAGLVLVVGGIIGAVRGFRRTRVG